MTNPFIITHIQVRERTWGRDNRRDADSPAGRTRVYVHPEGENIIENLMNRRSRPYKLYRPLVEKALRHKKIDWTKLKWSQKAGCTMCPCSPGFIVEGSRGLDIWVTISTKEDQADPEDLTTEQMKALAQWSGR